MEIVFRHELAGQTNVLRKLLGRQEEAFILRRGSDLARFDLHQAETTGPITPATGTNQESGALRGFPARTRLAKKGSPERRRWS